MNTIHTVCSKRGGSTKCVEVFLDESMEVVEASKPYLAQSKSSIRLDGSLAQVSSQSLQQQKKLPANTGCPGCQKAEQAQKSGLLSRLAKGVPGLLKSELGIDLAGPSLVAERRDICLSCPSGMYDFGVCSEERGGCGCFLASKVKIKGEACPEGHW